MKIWCLISLSVFCLSGCASRETIKLPEKVYITVTKACLDRKDVPVRPMLREDVELLAMDRYKRTIAMWDERRAREEYEKKQAAILEACTR